MKTITINEIQQKATDYCSKRIKDFLQQAKQNNDPCNEQQSLYLLEQCFIAGVTYALEELTNVFAKK